MLFASENGHNGRRTYGYPIGRYGVRKCSEMAIVQADEALRPDRAWASLSSWRLFVD